MSKKWRLISRSNLAHSEICFFCWEVCSRLCVPLGFLNSWISVNIGSDNGLLPDGAEPLPRLMWAYQVNPQKHISMKSYWKYSLFHSRKCIWKCRLQNVSHFCSGLNSSNGYQLSIQQSDITVMKWKWFYCYELHRCNNNSKLSTPSRNPNSCISIFCICWWRHNRLLMTSQWPDSCDAITSIMISNSLDIIFFSRRY